MTNRLQTELHNILNGNRFTAIEARALLSFDWEKDIVDLPRRIQGDVREFYIFVQSQIDEVDDGFADDANRPDMLSRISVLLAALPNAKAKST